MINLKHIHIFLKKTIPKEMEFSYYLIFSSQFQQCLKFEAHVKYFAKGLIEQILKVNGDIKDYDMKDQFDKHHTFDDKHKAKGDGTAYAKWKII